MPMEAQNHPERQAAPNLARASRIAFLVALGLTTALHITQASAPYTYRHGFISAVFATSAREFARDGIVRLGGVPVANNPPIGPNDSYAHWPPLLPMSLSLWFRLFGTSEIAGHLYMLSIEVIAALLICALGRDAFGTAAGYLAGFFWLTMPVVVHYAHV